MHFPKLFSTYFLDGLKCTSTYKYILKLLTYKDTWLNKNQKQKQKERRYIKTKFK